MDFCGDSELCDDYSHRVGVLGKLPGAGQLHHLLKGIHGIQRFGVIKTLNEWFYLIEVRFLPQQVELLEVQWQSEL